MNMVHDVRSSASPLSYNLVTEEGVLQALAFVRTSRASISEKRELRNLIFSYANAGGDPALRHTLESRLAVLAAGAPASPTVPNTDRVTVAGKAGTPALADTVAASPRMSAAVTPAVRIGTRRPQPIFTPAAIAVSSPCVPTESVVSVETSLPAAAPVAAVPVVPTPTVVPLDVVLAAVPPAPASVAVEAPTPAPAPAPHSAPVPHDVLEVVAVASPVPPEAPTPTPTPTPTPVSAPVTPVPAPVAATGVAVEQSYEMQMEQYRRRIAEVKQMINAKVGNAVNLVDMDNVVGREYMTVLLEAMKVVSGGAGDARSIMTRFEAAAAKVETLLANERPAPTPATTPVVESPAVAVRPMPSAVPTTTVTPPVAVEVAPADVAAPTPVTPLDIPAKAVTATPVALPSVADAVPLKTPADLPTAADVKAGLGITDPLLDPDVDAGLEQLLGEWQLFKKSGVFGTGPHGRQHPLFLKLAPLQMPLILSGRFEGATNEIRQSITDYMNGWRYEQGIVFENDETFEHYLRRVIRYIIDSQTKRTQA